MDGAKKQEVGRGVRSPRGRPGGQPLPREHYKNLNCTSRAGPLSSERVWNGGVFLWGCLEGLPLIFLRTGLLLLPVLSPGEEQTRRKGDVGASKNVSVSTFQLPQAERAKQTVSALMALLFPLSSGGNCFSFLSGELWRLLAALQKNNITTNMPYGGLQGEYPCRF